MWTLHIFLKISWVTEHFYLKVAIWGSTQVKWALFKSTRGVGRIFMITIANRKLIATKTNNIHYICHGGIYYSWHANFIRYSMSTFGMSKQLATFTMAKILKPFPWFSQFLHFSHGNCHQHIYQFCHVFLEFKLLWFYILSTF